MNKEIIGINPQFVEQSDAQDLIFNPHEINVFLFTLEKELEDVVRVLTGSTDNEKIKEYVERRFRLYSRDQIVGLVRYFKHMLGSQKFITIDQLLEAIRFPNNSLSEEATNPPKQAQQATTEDSSIA
jgi:hypothetical protein